MIIRSTGQRLLFITQPDHAHLSRRIMERCAALRAHPRAASILLAIGEHDNGWAEADAAPTVDAASGRPFDFVSAPLEVRHEVWGRGIARLAAAEWAAALVANHAITVYDRYRADAAWNTFFARMEALRTNMLEASGGSLDDLLADYVYVRLGDLLSLVFCTGWTEAQRFGDWTATGSGSSVFVTPDLFGGETVPLEIEARALPERPYRSTADLRHAFARAEVLVLRGHCQST